MVPGPPEGSRGSTGWGHPFWRASWAEVGREPAHSGLVRPPLGPLRLGLETLGWGRLHLPWGASLPLGHRPPLEMPSPGAGAPQGAYIKGGREGSCTSSLGASLSPATPLPLAEERRSPAAVTAASTTTTSCCWIFINLSFPLAGSRRRRRHPLRTCVERGGAVRSALGSSVIWITSSTSSSSPFFERFRA